MEDRFKRALADLDNYRKRSAREIERLVAERGDAALLDWLEVVDGVERALQQKPENPLYDGLRAVLEQMDVDPRRATASAGSAQPASRSTPRATRPSRSARPSEAPDRAVVEVARSGYARGDRVLRPAQVVVVARAAAARDLMAVGYRDYYETLGVPRDAEPGGHPRRASPARPPVPPGRQQGPGRRGPLQGGLGGLRGAPRPREARALRPPRPNWRAGQDVSGTSGFEGFRGGGGGFEDVRVDFGGGRRCSATSSKGCSGAAVAGAAPRASAGGFSIRGARPRGGARALARGGRSRRAAPALARRARLRGRDPARRPRRPADPPCGEGDRGVGGGPSGDLFLRVRVRPDKRFRVEGRDIYTDLPVAPWEAALGAPGRGPDAPRHRPGQGPAGLVVRRRLRLRGEGRRRRRPLRRGADPRAEAAERPGAGALRAARRGVRLQPAPVSTAKQSMR